MVHPLEYKKPIAKLGLNPLDMLENMFHLCRHECNYPAGIVFA